MALDARQRARFRDLAQQTAGIDVEVYQRFGKDPLDPVIAPDAPQAPLGFFGRDPGRDEVQHGQPFIGSGGQLVRRALYQHLHGKPLPDFQASLDVGRPFFWANTVPYKPLGNKAWSTKVKQRFHAAVCELLIDHWQGEHIISLGREAFLWFGIGQTKAERARIEAFWERDDRFESSVTVTLATDAGHTRAFHLYPLPHPSPLNATWYGKFPGLLKARLEQLQPHL